MKQRGPVWAFSSLCHRLLHLIHQRRRWGVCLCQLFQVNSRYLGTPSSFLGVETVHHDVDIEGMKFKFGSLFRKQSLARSKSETPETDTNKRGHLISTSHMYNHY